MQAREPAQQRDGCEEPRPVVVDGLEQRRDRRVDAAVAQDVVDDADVLVGPGVAQCPVDDLRRPVDDQDEHEQVGDEQPRSRPGATDDRHEAERQDAERHHERRRHHREQAEVVHRARVDLRQRRHPQRHRRAQPADRRRGRVAGQPGAGGRERAACAAGSRAACAGRRGGAAGAHGGCQGPQHGFDVAAQEQRVVPVARGLLKVGSDVVQPRQQHERVGRHRAVLHGGGDAPLVPVPLAIAAQLDDHPAEVLGLDGRPGRDQQLEQVELRQPARAGSLPVDDPAHRAVGRDQDVARGEVAVHPRGGQLPPGRRTQLLPEELQALAGAAPHDGAQPVQRSVDELRHQRGVAAVLAAGRPVQPRDRIRRGVEQLAGRGAGAQQRVHRRPRQAALHQVGALSDDAARDLAGDERAPLAELLRLPELAQRAGVGPQRVLAGGRAGALDDRRRIGPGRTDDADRHVVERGDAALDHPRAIGLRELGEQRPQRAVEPPSPQMAPAGADRGERPQRAIGEGDTARGDGRGRGRGRRISRGRSRGRGLSGRGLSGTEPPQARRQEDRHGDDRLAGEPADPQAVDPERPHQRHPDRDHQAEQRDGGADDVAHAPAHPSRVGVADEHHPGQRRQRQQPQQRGRAVGVAGAEQPEQPGRDDERDRDARDQQPGALQQRLAVVAGQARGVAGRLGDHRHAHAARDQVQAVADRPRDEVVGARPRTEGRQDDDRKQAHRRGHDHVRREVRGDVARDHAGVDPLLVLPGRTLMRGQQAPEQQPVDRQDERRHRRHPRHERPQARYHEHERRQRRELEDRVDEVLQRDPVGLADPGEDAVLQDEDRPRHRRQHEPDGDQRAGDDAQGGRPRPDAGDEPEARHP